MPLPDDLNEEKVAELAMAILSLSRMSDSYGVRAWKGMDWDVLDLLYKRGWISDPVGKQKSVGITEEGIKSADEFIEKHLTN